MCQYYLEYHQTSNIRRALVGNKLVDHSDAAGASPVGLERMVEINTAVVL